MEPFLGEIRMTSFAFAPRGWALCNGQLLPINQNQPLYSLLGNRYGGDGRVTFGLPDLRGRTPIHTPGGAQGLGERGGEQQHTLLTAELPPHEHMLYCAAGGSQTPNPAGAVLAPANNLYYSSPSNPRQVEMSPSSVAPSGGGQAHDNMQPFLTVSFSIALQGIWPSVN